MVLLFTLIINLGHSIHSYSTKCVRGLQFSHLICHWSQARGLEHFIYSHSEPRHSGYDKLAQNQISLRIVIVYMYKIWLIKRFLWWLLWWLIWWENADLLGLKKSKSTQWNQVTSILVICLPPSNRKRMHHWPQSIIVK